MNVGGVWEIEVPSDECCANVLWWQMFVDAAKCCVYSSWWPLRWKVKVDNCIHVGGGDNVSNEYSSRCDDGGPDVVALG